MFWLFLFKKQQQQQQQLFISQIDTASLVYFPVQLIDQG